MLGTRWQSNCYYSAAMFEHDKQNRIIHISVWETVKLLIKPVKKSLLILAANFITK